MVFQRRMANRQLLGDLQILRVLRGKLGQKRLGQRVVSGNNVN